MKEVKKRSKNFYLNTIVQTIKSNSRLPQYTKLGLKSKQALNYYIQDLKRSGFINKLGYGTWEVLKDFNILELKEVKKIATGNLNSHSLKEDNVRGHAFMFHLKIPTLPNWPRRAEYLKKKGIKYKTLNNLGNGQKLILKGKITHLKNNCIIIYDKESYIAEKAQETKSTAIYEFLKVINHLENILGVTFQINKQYVFKVCREHYALIKNCLARQYDKEKNKLRIYSSKGLWLLIDNSYNLHETETLLLNEAVSDNEGIKKYFNEHKQTGFKVTPQFVLDNLNVLIEDRKYWAENQKTHVAAIQELAAGVRKQTAGIGKLIDIIKKFKKE